MLALRDASGELAGRAGRVTSPLRLVRRPEPPSRLIWWVCGLLVGLSLGRGWVWFALLVLVAMWGLRRAEG